MCDVHVLVWLYVGLAEKFSDPIRELINDHDASISPIVRLELQFLQEIGRVTDAPDSIIADLAGSIGVQICDRPFENIVSCALACSWTSDPFDRLIVANAALNDDILLSKDRNILENYTYARW